jgi:hypothetical protein
MNWPWRVVIIVPVSSLAVAEVAARAINSTGPEYSGQAFSMQLSASATDEMLTEMNDALPSVPGVKFWRHDTDGILASSNVTVPAGQAWGWEESIGSVGLSRILPTMPEPQTPEPLPEPSDFNVVPGWPVRVR